MAEPAQPGPPAQPAGTPRSATPAIEVSGLTKAYGTVRALDGVTFTVPQGSVFGFLGPNGAGKTTTLRILAGLARPTSGRASLLGHDASETDAALRAAVGYLPDVPAFYGWMTADRYLRFAGALYGLGGDVLDERVAALLDLAGLREVGTRIKGYSRGMKQRLGVAQALVGAPRLLLLDEPTSALDPLGRKEVLDMIAALGGRTTVFFSTHILADAERVCDRVAVLDRGRVVAQAGIDDLKARHGGSHRLLVQVDEPAKLVAALGGLPWVTSLETRADGALRITAQDRDVAERALPGVLAGAGLALRRLEADEVSLEEVFVDLVGEAAP